MGRHLHLRAPATARLHLPRTPYPHARTNLLLPHASVPPVSHARALPGSHARTPLLTSARPLSSRAVIMATMVQIPTDALKNINDTNAPSPGKDAEPKKRDAPDEGKEKKESPEKKAKEAKEDQEKQETEAPVSTDTDLKDADINEAKEGVEAEAEPKEPVVEQAPAKDADINEAKEGVEAEPKEPVVEQATAKDADVNEAKEGVEAEPKEPVVEAPAKATCVVE